MHIRLLVVGDFNDRNKSHLATNAAIEHSATALGLKVEHPWVGTDDVAAAGGLARLEGAAGLWIAPASPYRSMAGALAAIRLARERGIPLLGTCGGFQHIIIEYARDVLGLSDAEHEESAPGAARLIIARLTCSLAGRTLTIRFQHGSLVARAYGRDTAEEQYHCNFGVNPDYVDRLSKGNLRVVGSDAEGTIRAVELAGHPFFVGTLFLPQLNSTAAAPHPLIVAFLRAAQAAADRGAGCANEQKRRNTSHSRRFATPDAAA